MKSLIKNSSLQPRYTNQKKGVAVSNVPCLPATIVIHDFYPFCQIIIEYREEMVEVVK